MLNKWKIILLNWINCYSNESGKNEENLELEFLHIIITHLRESFNLDESKSSILDARTIEEFLQEKFPEFKFENGTVEARNEDEICIAASLLLFFVCVNSKEVDIKNAMCSRLSREDQEIILKFSKNLMECSPILCRDVEVAIADACGKDEVSENTRCQVAVAETPPVLRSLHSEVRRLQAALDAEQFDRNYLQEELTRTNLRVEQLLKDKEQYKLDILNLKAKLSLSSNQEDEALNSEAQLNNTTKLSKELQDMEKQLIQTQTELNDIVHERDVYKSKAEELKKDRDKWLALSQQEAEQVVHLTEELEAERRNVISLKELVNEIQLHNKLNRVDSSLLECDDPDTSMQSFRNNSSVCSEACSNVIELQLGEERAKIVVLEEQIQKLLDQIKDLNEKYTNDKQTYETILNERETDIFNLKHRINEEIEKQSNIKAYFNNEVTKLNNEVNELEQRLKGNNENSRSIIERKMQEIQLLQEEKLSLLQSLTDESIKNENIIKTLREEIDLEKRTKTNMKDTCEKQIMNLNEKVLNRNNELVELQNNILEKSEIIESLHLDLRKAKEMREENANKYHNDLRQLIEQNEATEQYLLEKSNEVAELKAIAEQKITLINELQQEMSILKLSLSKMKEKYKHVEDTKETLQNEIHNRDMKLKELCQEIDVLKNLHSEEKEKLTYDLDEKNATINALKEQLQDEIHYKISFQNELTNLQKINIELSGEIKAAHTEISKKDETIKEIDMDLQKVKEYSTQLVADLDKSNENLNKITEDMNKKQNELTSISNNHVSCIKDFQEELRHKEEIIDIANEKLKTVAAEKDLLQEKINLVNSEKLILEKDIAGRNEKITKLEADREERLCVVEEEKLAIEHKLIQINKRYKELEKSFDMETSKMLTKLNKTEKTIKELSANSKNTIRKQELEIQKLNIDNENATKTIQDIRTSMLQLEREKEALVQKLDEEMKNKNNFENEYQNQLVAFNQVTTQLDEEIGKQKEEVNDLKAKLASSEQIIDERNKDQKRENALMCTKLNTALDKLIDGFKKEDIDSEVIQELIMVDNIRDMTCSDKCDLLINIAGTLARELSISRNLEKALEHETSALNGLRELCKEKEIQIFNLQTDIKRLEQIIHEQKLESLKQAEIESTTVNSKIKDIQALEKENQNLNNSLNDVKFQLEIKVHSLKEKLTDNENLTDKLKSSYDAQIDNLNLMITKLTNYLKEKTTELEATRKQNEELQRTVENNKEVIKSLEDEIKAEKQNREKISSDFESERLILKNMITVTESVMEDQKISLNNIITQHKKANEILAREKESLMEANDKEKDRLVMKLREKDAVLETILNELSGIKEERDKIKEVVTTHSESVIYNVNLLKDELVARIYEIQALDNQNKDNTELQKYKEDINTLEKENNELKIKIDLVESEKHSRVEDLTRLLDEQVKINKDLEITLKEKINYCEAIEENIKTLSNEINVLGIEKSNIELEYEKLLDEANDKFNVELEFLAEKVETLTSENAKLAKINEEHKAEISHLKQQTKDAIEQNAKLSEDIRNEKMVLIDKCSILQDYQVKAEKLLEERQKEMNLLQQEIDTLKTIIGKREEDLIAKDGFISKISREKDEIIDAVSKELCEEKSAREKIAASYMAAISARQSIEDNLMQAIGQQETCLLQNQDKKNTKPYSADDNRFLHQVDNTSSDFAQSSMDSLKTISDLEKILDDKNRKITTLQTDITHLRSILAESETQLIDARLELDMSKENCQQLSTQLKKIVHQKNEEIGELKRQVNKMSVTENRATQIIKVSAKYQAIILKKIAEIKSNTVLKELTNFGNTNSSDELRRNLPGSVTMEDLESFLETTDRHLKRCSEKQASLQKDRDRLTEVNRINESEIINLRKYLMEISLSYQTFGSVKEMYVQKLSRVLSIQRTVRREILNLDGHVTFASMCKLERGYAAIMQDLSECVMNLERWVERCIAQTVTPEKIKQALLVSRNEPVSVSATGIQNTGLEVQIDELGNSFEKLLEEVARASKGERCVDAQAITVTEVRAEYEDKLNRMKSKMNQLYHEQIGVFKEKQKEEIALLKRELQKTRDKLAKSSEEYEDHIRKLTAELWRVGERFVVEKAEADDLRRKNRSGSLMSLQHVHSSGFAPTLEKIERPSDTHSLRSLPLDMNAKREGRDLHMSDEEEVFDNRYLKELLSTPRGDAQPPGVRLSELRWRNSLCPPHLKSSYPAETQFANAIDEDDIKCVGSMPAGKQQQQRKEVGITAYKKPGPPTPSKQAGRLSATGSELRDSLRVEADPHPSRKTSTPSRIRSFFRSNRNETNEGTPRSRKRSGFFRKI